MKTIFGLLILFAGFVVGSTIAVAALSAESLDQRLVIIQTSDPSVRQVVGEILPASGQVRLVINVDETGKLADWMLIDYAHVRFADAAVEALKNWQFRPAVFHGVPIGVRTEIVFNFETRGQVVSLSGADILTAYVSNTMGNQQIKRVCARRELDAAPTPIVMVAPKPIHLTDTPDRAQGVLVDFYIDETGKPRMATVDAGGNELMAAASLQAIEQWRFTPPMRKGSPVAVRAVQRFDFSQSEATAK